MSLATSTQWIVWAYIDHASLASVTSWEKPPVFIVLKVIAPILLVALPSAMQVCLFWVINPSDAP